MPGCSPVEWTSTSIGGSPAEHPDRMAAISSSSHVSESAPPTLVIEPEGDGLVPPSGVHGFSEAARAAGVDVTVTGVPHANHVFNQLAASSIGNQAELTTTDHNLAGRGPAPAPSV